MPNGGTWLQSDCDRVLDGIFDNPSQLIGRSLREVKARIGDVESPWIEGTLGKGIHAGQEWTVRELSQSGGYADDRFPLPLSLIGV